MSNKTLTAIIVLLLVIFAGIIVAVKYKNFNSAGNSQDQTAYTNQPTATATPIPTLTPTDTPLATSTPTSTPTSMTTACKNNFDQNKFNTAKVATHNRVVQLDVKDFGIMKIALDDAAAPKTVENFLKLVNAGFYDCLTFHRVAQGFVIQGGDPKGDGSGGPGYTVPAEIKLTHKRGAIAMARLGDQVNPNKESSGSQFYVALNDLPQLDGQYTVFGLVTNGLEVADKIGALETNPPGDGAPLKPVIITKAVIIK